MARDRNIEKAPTGGWLGPLSSIGLAPIATAIGHKKGKWLWKKSKLSEKQIKKHAKFQKRMVKEK